MNIMKIVAVADLHGRLPRIPVCDLLLIAGDISPNQCRNFELVNSWMVNRFRPWLAAVPAKHVIGIAGNHDFIFRGRTDLVPRNMRWHYLQDSGIELEGVKIWGSPWSLTYRGWAFEADDEEELPAKYALIPEGTGIILSHCPPYGIADTSLGNPAAGPIGSRALLERICVVKPKLVIFGHAHTAHHGPVEIVPGVTGFNVACADERNHPAYEPTVIELDIENTNEEDSNDYKPQ